MIEISSEYPALVRSRIDEDRFWIWVPQNEKENAGLVGGFNHLEKYESQWDGWHPIYYGKKCLKPPTTGWFINMSICQHAKLVPRLQKPTDEINFCTWEVRKFSRLQPSASPPSISLGGNPLMNITLIKYDPTKENDLSLAVPYLIHIFSSSLLISMYFHVFFHVQYVFGASTAQPSDTANRSAVGTRKDPGLLWQDVAGISTFLKGLPGHCDLEKSLGEPGEEPKKSIWRTGTWWTWWQLQNGVYELCIYIYIRCVCKICIYIYTLENTHVSQSCNVGPCGDDSLYINMCIYIYI